MGMQSSDGGKTQVAYAAGLGFLLVFNDCNNKKSVLYRLYLLSCMIMVLLVINDTYLTICIHP